MPKVIIEELSMAPIENLIFEGGGVKGIAYVGALKALYAQGMMDHVKRVGGSSAGGITAMLVGLGYQLEEIQEIMKTMDFTKFQDAGETFWQTVPKELDFLNLREKAVKKVEEALKVATSKKHGIYRGDVFLEWARAKVAEKLGNPDATFADLREAMKVDPALKDMMFTATNISGNGQPLQYFDAEHTPHVRIADAVRATMSFPGAFEAYPIVVNGTRSIFVDGGVVNNYPIEYFDDPKFLPKGSPARINPRSLGVRVDCRDEVNNNKWRLGGGEASDTDSVVGFGKGLVGATLSDRTKVYTRGFNTVQIPDCGIATLNFNLTDDDKQALQTSGETAITEFIGLYYKGAIADTKKYKDLSTFYRSKIAEGEEGVKEVLNKKNELMEELERITLKPARQADVALRSQDEIKLDKEDQKRFHEILWEYDIVNRALAGIDKTKDQALMEAAGNLLEMQASLAEKNHEELLEFHQYGQGLLEKIEKLRDGYHLDSATFEKLMTLKEANELLQKTFDEIAALHQELSIVRAKLIKIMQSDPYDGIKVMELQSDLLTKHIAGAKKIQAYLSEGLNRPGIRSVIGDNIKKVEQLILSEVTSLANEKAATYKPPSLEEFQENLRHNQEMSNKKVDEISLALHQQKEQLKKNEKRLQRLKFEKSACGKNLDKMLNLSNNLSDFITSQNSLGTGMCKFARGFAKALGILSTSYPIYLLIRTGIKKFAKKETYENMKKFEKRFYTNQEIYVKHARKLRNDIKALSEGWASDTSKAYNPQDNVKSVLTMLRQTQERAKEGHHEKRFQKETKTKFDTMLSQTIEDIESDPSKLKK